jgi:hypothetical protein
VQRSARKLAERAVSVSYETVLGVTEQHLPIDSTDDPIAALWPIYTNNTCLPTENSNATCTRGFYGDYVILATKKSHIKAGVDFARTHNLRLIMYVPSATRL